MFDIVTDMLKLDEGLRLNPYKDTVGKTTIGYGRNLDDLGISKAEAEIMLCNDVNIAYKETFRVIDIFEKLNEVRRAVLVNMVFNLGLPRFLKFKKTIQAIHAEDFERAAKEMLDSLWAKQVKNRAKSLAHCMETGENHYQEL